MFISDENLVVVYFVVFHYESRFIHPDPNDRHLLTFNSMNNYCV